MYLTQKSLSRRTLLRGLGATLALPWLDAMQPAGRVAAASRPLRLVCLEMVHGAAGTTPWGRTAHLWAPAATGAAFDLTPSSLRPLDPWRAHLTIVSQTDARNAEALDPAEIGGNHTRASSVFLTQAHPKQTRGAAIQAGVSLDQFYAQRVGQQTPLPSLQLCIEGGDGGCSSYGYSCVYQDTISWAAPTQPLPMMRDPRLLFDQLFGVGTTAADRGARRQQDRSLLDGLLTVVTRLRQDVGAADRLRLQAYLDDIREIERRLQQVEATNQSAVERALPQAPLGVPDAFSEHVGLLFDLQALAFAADLTRVSAFKLSRDATNRAYPESGITTGFHPASHHGDRAERIQALAQINTFHVSLLPRFLAKLQATTDGEGTLLDNSLILYGSPMADSNVHSHQDCPLILLGHAGGRLPGEQHLRAPQHTPMANVFLGLLHTLGLDDVTHFGDSTAAFDLRAAA